MVEVLLAGAVMTAGAVAVARRSLPNEVSRNTFHGGADVIDLPCPWCNAATREDDPRCPSCGQRFG
ncbi:MAG TPA: hypothetical protein VGC47_10520 [Acidimicrobiia bacterium]|jgi:hypothetical protein